jgi:hypothetical protein
MPAVIPVEVVEVRKEICGRCPTPCGAIPPPEDPCSQCPLKPRRWGPYGRCRHGAAPPLGLGDAVAAIATPIARALKLPCIDPATKQLRPESPCSKKKNFLNRKTEEAKAALRNVLPNL